MNGIVKRGIALAAAVIKNRMVKRGLTLLGAGIGVIVLTVIVAPFALAAVLKSVPVEGAFQDAAYGLIYQAGLYIARGITTLALAVSALGLIVLAIAAWQAIIAWRK